MFVTGRWSLLGVWVLFLFCFPFFFLLLGVRLTVNLALTLVEVGAAVGLWLLRPSALESKKRFSQVQMGLRP